MVVIPEAIRDELARPLFEYTDEIASFAWDFARLQTLHKNMSDEMAKEVRYLGELTAMENGRWNMEKVANE